MSQQSIAHSRLNPSFRSSSSRTSWSRRGAALLRRWAERSQQRRYRIVQRRHENEDRTDRYVDAHGELRIDEASAAALWQR